ncbi:MAG: histidine--tRNA ligase [Candidatus Geothermincolia bacterium]
MPEQAPKGMSDILPPASAAWREAIHRAEEVFLAYGYELIMLPLLEHTPVFQKGIGESTDIVQKEMFTFQDRGDEWLTLRPEGTAGVARAFCQSMTKSPQPLKLYYHGPMFRRERPQKGRYRQFFQLGVELLGPAGPLADAEVISLCRTLIDELAGGAGEVELLLNSVGDGACRPAYQRRLAEYLERHAGSLCEDCRRRAATNPLRAFDCKEAGCAEVTREAPRITAHLCGDCRTHLEETMALLAAAGIRYRLLDTLVRGLDYYTRTVFEFQTPHLGAQNTVAAGGRYDGLIEMYGGPATPATGFSLGLERLLLMAPEAARERERSGFFLVALAPDERRRAFTLAQELRRAGQRCEIDTMARSMKAQLKVADRVRSRYAVFIREDELKKGITTVRDLAGGEQRQVGAEAADILAKTGGGVG